MSIPPVDRIDFFISRANSDKAIAHRVAEIIRESGGSCFHQDEGFGNSDFMRRMEQAYAARRTIALLSRDYQRSEFCRVEYNQVLGKDPANLHERLIVFRVSDCSPVDALQNIRYTDLVPILSDATALKRVVRVALGYEQSVARADDGQIYARAGLQVRHPEIRAFQSFTGRTAVLADLASKFWSGAAHASGEMQIILRGLAGVGKTLLARQYAWENKERYHGVWWVRAEQRDTLIDDIVSLGRRLIPGLELREPEPAAIAALDWLAQMPTQKPWLIVYDNVEDLAAVRRFFPSGNAHLLITTRLADRDDDSESLPVDVFDRDTAIAYLLTEDSGRIDEQQRAAAQLADELDRLPLALAHARAYCSAQRWSFDEYAAALPDLIRRRPRDATYPRSIFVTFSLAIERAAREHPLAERVMGALAFLAPDHIPLELLVSDMLPLAELGDAISALGAASLVTLGTTAEGRRVVSVHKLVQEVTRSRLKEQGAFDTAAATVSVLIDRAFKKDDSIEAHSDNILLLPHAISALPYAPRDGWGSYCTFGICISIGKIFSRRGDFTRAESSYREAHDLAVTQNRAAPGDLRWKREVAASKSFLGTVFLSTGRAAMAVAMFQDYLGMTQRILKHQPLDLALQRDVSVAHTKVGDALATQGRHRRSIGLYRRGTRIAEKMRAADPLDELAIQQDLALLYARLGAAHAACNNTRRALRYTRAAHSINERLLAAEPASTSLQLALSTSHECLGNLLLTKGQLDKSLSAHSSALSIRQSLVEKDPANAEWLHALAIAYNNRAFVQTCRAHMLLAIGDYSSERATLEKLVEIAPEGLNWKAELGASYCKVALFYSTMSPPEMKQKALEQYRTARSIIEPLAKQLDGRGLIEFLREIDRSISILIAGGPDTVNVHLAHALIPQWRRRWRPAWLRLLIGA